MSAAVLARDIAARRLPADAGVRAAQSVIEALNERLNAIVEYDRNASRPQLAELERRLAARESLPLAGVTVAVKDHFSVQGWRCSEGSPLFRDRIAVEDEPVVARLRAAGAILMGRSNMSEFGCKGVTTNLLYGATRHPQDERLTPGGSSGGAATAVASGMVELALASDGGGSVRRPAAHVGVVGFKPSTGAVADPRAFTHTSVFGCMANSVADAKLMFGVIVGADPRDPLTQPMPSETDASPKQLSIAFSPRLGLDVPIDPDVAACVSAAIARLRAAGFRIADADPIWPAGASEEALMPLQHCALAATFGKRWREDPYLFDPDIGTQIESGLRLSGTDVSRAQDMSLAIARAAAAFFAGGYDLLISPTTPCVAWPLTELGPKTIGGNEVGPRGHAVFTPFFNHAFCPAISIPAGTGRNDLPVGLQIAGARFSDWRVLATAEAMAAAL